ncbi:Secreted RxLR effector protein 161, partial [Cucurbita argyrosperma subsp. sororia]
MVGSSFGPLRPLQRLTLVMSPGPGPPVSPGVFIPPFSPPVWLGARGIDMSMLAVPPEPLVPRFPPTIGTPPSAAMYFNQSGSGRSISSGVARPGFNNSRLMGRGAQPDKNSSVFVDADWAGDVNDRHSTRGFCFTAGFVAISWCSKKQSTVAFSSCESEYVALQWLLKNVYGSGGLFKKW